MREFAESLVGVAEGDDKVKFDYRFCRSVFSAAMRFVQYSFSISQHVVDCTSAVFKTHGAAFVIWLNQVGFHNRLEVQLFISRWPISRLWCVSHSLRFSLRLCNTKMASKHSCSRTRGQACFSRCLINPGLSLPPPPPPLTWASADLCSWLYCKWKISRLLCYFCVMQPRSHASLYLHVWSVGYSNALSQSPCIDFAQRRLTMHYLSSGDP